MYLFLLGFVALMITMTEKPSAAQAVEFQKLM